VNNYDKNDTGFEGKNNLIYPGQIAKYIRKPYGRYKKE
jgi:hypothetical protein